MTRIAVIGANGQVGAEVCLLLAARGADVVPIARNRFGSAFLRYHGLPCRHGLVADPAQAARLLGDCDVVVNLTLASIVGRPAEARRINRALAENAARGSAPGARIVHCSTIEVYGDHRPGPRIRWRNAYGREKRTGERRAVRAGRRLGREVYVVRLGHVCGEHQNITRLIREHVASRPVRIPRIDRPSNCVYTATIVDAILKIAAGHESPGTYDLLNRPQWSWRAVFSYEAQRTGRTAEFELVPDRPRATLASRASGLSRRIVRALGRGGLAKELALRSIARLSSSWGGRIQAFLYRTRALAESAELYGARVPVFEALDWIDHDRRHLSSLAPTAELLAAGAGDVPPVDRARSWPADLPPARER
jgi:nucleoside-diphosphate-sugar epimerase